MTPPAPFHDWHGHFAIELAGATAVFTTRRGGVSAGPYATLNLGRLTADAPEAVAENRARLEDQVGRRLAYVRQVHGDRIKPASDAVEEADGHVTADRDLAPLVLTADCLPVALATPRATAMLHAGWRGLDAGIIGAGVRALRELASHGPLAAAIGPGAGPCCYAVTAELHARFARFGPAARNGANLDLKAVARHQLEAEGVESIHDIGLCTICGDPELFFSHRRDQGVTGRQAGLVWLS